MKNEIIQHSIKELEKICIFYKIEAIVNYSNKAYPKFTIKINNNYLKKFALSLANNIIDINEESFYSISVYKKNRTTFFSFLGIKGKELTFFTNLLNFIKIIKLNNLFNFEINTLEELIPAKMIQVANTKELTYIILEKTLKADNQYFKLENAIKKLSESQNITNTYCNFNLQKFCKTANITVDALQNIEKIFSN